MTPNTTEISVSRLEVLRCPGKPTTVLAPVFDSLMPAIDWLVGNKDAIRALVLDHGHALLRGMPVRTAEDFARLRDVLMPERAYYKEKATPRSSYGNDVYSSTDLPAAHAIRLHNENSYTLDFPGALAFCCLESPTEGGATTIADMREVLRLIPPQLREKFRSVGWSLMRNYDKLLGLPWEVAFGSPERQAVEAYCKNNLIEAEWLGEGRLRTVQRRPAIIRHPVTREEVWFNHVAFWNSWSLEAGVRNVLIETYGREGIPFETTFGNGDYLSEDEVRALNSAYDAATRREQWRVGDLLFVDNVICAHGRDSYKGRRKVVVAMGEPVALNDCDPIPTPGRVPLGDA